MEKKKNGNGNGRQPWKKKRDSSKIKTIITLKNQYLI